MATTVTLSVNKTTFISGNVATGITGYATPAIPLTTPVSATTRSDLLSLTTDDIAYVSAIPAFATELFNTIVSERGIGGSCELRYIVQIGTTFLRQGLIGDGEIVLVGDVATPLTRAIADTITTIRRERLT